VKFVGTHYSANLIAPALVIETRYARPKACDIENQLGALEDQKLQIVGDLKVLPDVVGDSAAHVALEIGIVRHPTLRVRVEVALLRFLLSIAAALPWKHGSFKPRASGRGARLADPPVAIDQKRSSDFG